MQMERYSSGKGEKMYEVKNTGETFTFYMAAVKAAEKIFSEVIETSSGLIKWTPAKVSKKQMRLYGERKAAYEAQERMTDAR